MNKKVEEQMKGLQPGDLIRVEWYDASIGKSITNGSIDVPVKSWGIYIGVLGQKQKHIILAQNGFRYSDGLYDVDYTAIPLTWTVSVKVIDKEQVTSEEAEKLLTSFLLGKRRTVGRIRQRRIVNHELD